MHVPASTQHSLLKAAGIILTASALVNVLNYFFTILIAKQVTPPELGEIGSLIALATIIIFPTQVITLYTARESARGVARPLILFEWRTILASTAAALALFIASPLLGDSLNIQPSAIAALALIIPFSIITSLNRGILQGKKHFSRFGQIAVIEAAIKIIIGLILVRLIHPALAVGLALAGAYAISALASIYLVKHIPGSANTSLQNDKKIGTKHEMIRIAMAMAALSLLVHSDVILATMVLPPQLAGEYAALAVMGKIITYGAPGIAVALFPFIAENHHSPATQQKNLRTSLYFTILFCAAGAALYLAAPRLIITALFDQSYLTVIPYLPYMSLIAAASALLHVLTMYFIARKTYTFAKYLAAIALAQIAVIATGPDNLTAILSTVLAATLAAAAISLLIAWHNPAVPTLHTHRHAPPHA